MHITPKRRRRILQAHYLRQRGLTLRKIAEQLNVSHATIRADLQLAESHWNTIAAAAADDLLLESLQLLSIRLSLAIEHDDVANNADRLTPVDFLRAREAQETRLTTLAREIRRTAQDIHQRAEQRTDQPDLFHELSQDSQELAEPTTESSAANHLESTTSQPEQEIVSTDPSEEKNCPAYCPPTHPRPRSAPWLRTGAGARPGSEPRRPQPRQGSPQLRHQRGPPALPTPQRPARRPNPPIPRPTHQPRSARPRHPSTHPRRRRRRPGPVRSPRALTPLCIA